MTDGSGSASVRGYVHSGKVPGSAVGAGLIGAGVVALVFGPVLAVLELVLHNLPFAKARLVLIFVVMVSLSFLLGRVCARIFMRFKARSDTAATVLGAVAGLVGLYVAWIAWLYGYAIYVKAPVSFSSLLWPGTVFSRISELSSSNAWNVFGDDTGNLVPLGIFWAMEAVIAIGAAGIAARLNMMSGVFCENCDTWGVSKRLMRLVVDDIAALRASLARGEIEPLLRAGEKKEPAESWVDVSLRGCPKCGHLQLLSVTQVLSTTDKNGKKSDVEELLVNNLLLSPEQSGALIRAAAELRGPGESRW